MAGASTSLCRIPTGTAPAHATQATVRVHPELGGFWSLGRYEEKKTAENPHPMVVEFIFGYDVAAKGFTLDGYDVIGDHSHQTAPAWQDGKLVLDGQNVGADGQAVPARDTFAKKSDTVMEHLGEMQLGGQWTRIDAETCTRVDGPNESSSFWPWGGVKSTSSVTTPARSRVGVRSARIRTPSELVAAASALSGEEVRAAAAPTARVPWTKSRRFIGTVMFGS